MEHLPDLSPLFDHVSDDSLEALIDTLEYIGAPDMPQGTALFETWNAAYTQKILRESR